MKKIFLGILIITLPLITFFQYKNYRRFHPSTSYEYLKSDEIDINYHDPRMIEEYFHKIVEVGAFARRKWKNEGIDVRFPNENVTETNVANYYNLLLTRIKEIEAKLETSAAYKAEGFNNEQIILLESGISKNQLRWISQKPLILTAVFGDRGAHIWTIQQLLIAKGYQHNLDGVFGLDTQNAILAFQRDKQIYSSGTIDEITFSELIK